MDYPPPHYILYEPLNNKETLRVWNDYKTKHEDCEFDEIDASTIFSAELFAPWFDRWITSIPRKQCTRIKILIIWHAEFLTFACQQIMRRQLEQRSFKNRVWFHVEDPTTLQSAIMSRCITKRMETFIRTPEYKYD
jgi:DNA polymerase III delta prime subunit